MSQDSGVRPPPSNPFSTLRSLVRQRTVTEWCELCSIELGPDHQHLLDPMTRQLFCACDACALLFSSQEATKYRRVPRRIRCLQDFRLGDSQWDDLMIPVGMAFFFRSSLDGQVKAFYPSPAGPTESLLSLEAWQELVQDNPILGTMAADVEALLVNRLKAAREYYWVPIDKCYELVGLIRTRWRGLSGGAEVWDEIGEYFDKLKAQSTPVGETSRA